MAARNPGPYLNQVPLGFPSYNRKVFRDILARRAFMESEVNTRVYKNIFENLGFKGQIRINNKGEPYEWPVIDIHKIHIHLR
ncbi:mitochondrial ribosomal protein S14 precursor [Plasmodium ovale wallikeri]|uniref:Mitochondrial ribosomal protein S14 n=1 Tax=Plasmodium ovale wallikeri TaxID=864142 RepID=A0A1A8ZH06_PLAOA|nr:mitochondrial ribosomal protein S14 precursor [Plasmodium ovale wallikeri]SBT43646.1 mitochondrial ribosomal protein S14 precursor [Plasmodium ovale wallikeri]